MATGEKRPPAERAATGTARPVRILLDPGPASAGRARQAVRQACADTAVAIDAVVLCTSELVTNAILHGVPPIELEILVGSDSVRVGVHDAGVRDVERRRTMSSDASSGRGLEIVDTLASRWGAERTGAGNLAWFEIDHAG